MMSGTNIANKLQDDYRKMLGEYGIVADGQDPVLSAFFKTIGARIESIATHAERVTRKQTLEGLVCALGIPAKRASAAQTVVRFSVPKNFKLFEHFTALVCQASNGDRLIFRTDEDLIAS